MRMWHDRLAERLRIQRERELFRAARRRDESLVDLTTNDYLALRKHPRLIRAVEQAAREQGVGAGASRLAGGTLPIHEQVEARFADFKCARRALLMPTGFHANLAVLTALPSAGDLILCDKLCHASLIDGARLSTSAHNVAFRAFAHRNASRAHELAERHLAQAPESTVWIVTDTVFSMDGDIADLPALAKVRDSLAGRACLIVDEAHATGVIGANGAGLDAMAGHVADVAVSTASKALGSLGGVVTASETVCAIIENFARAYIYTTAVPPTQAAAIDSALDIIEAEPERRERLASISRRVRDELRQQGWPVAPYESDPTPIVPLIVGQSERAIELSMLLHEQGFNAPAIRPPTVAPGAARVRLSLNTRLTDEDIPRLMKAINGWRGCAKQSHGKMRSYTPAEGLKQMNNRTIEILKAACCVAGIDGEISQGEHPLLKRMARAAGVGSQWLNATLERALNDPLYYERRFHLLRADPEETMAVLFEVALADEHFSLPERIILQNFAEKIGMDRERYEELLQRAEE